MIYPNLFSSSLLDINAIAREAQWRTPMCKEIAEYELTRERSNLELILS